MKVAALDSKHSTTPSDPRLYKKAVQNLASILQNRGEIESVYTHIEDILLYSMKESIFSEKLTFKVISLWLDNSESNRDFDTFIKECHAQGYDELKIVKLLMVKISNVYTLEKL